MHPGDPVLLRSIYRDNVRWAWPHHFVGEDDGRVGIYCRPGNHGKLMRREPGSGYLDAWVRGDPPHDHVWERTHVLRFVRAGGSHTIEVWWDESWSFLGWYLNLQSPLRAHGARFDTTDWALDVVVDPDGAWHWKDEDDFAQATALGVFDDVGPETVRAAGERAIAERPWPTGWEGWRPPAEWKPLPLPDDWHVV